MSSPAVPCPTHSYKLLGLIFCHIQERCTLLAHGRDPGKVDALVKHLQRYTPKVHGFALDSVLSSTVVSSCL